MSRPVKGDCLLTLSSHPPTLELYLGAIYPTKTFVFVGTPYMPPNPLRVASETFRGGWVGKKLLNNLLVNNLVKGQILHLHPQEVV